MERNHSNITTPQALMETCMLLGDKSTHAHTRTHGPASCCHGNGGTWQAERTQAFSAFTQVSFLFLFFSVSFLFFFLSALGSICQHAPKGREALKEKNPFTACILHRLLCEVKRTTSVSTESASTREGWKLLKKGRKRGKNVDVKASETKRLFQVNFPQMLPSSNTSCCM